MQLISFLHKYINNFQVECCFALLMLISSCTADYYNYVDNDNGLNIKNTAKETERSNSQSEITINIENPIISKYLDTQYNSDDYTYTNITNFVSINQAERRDVAEGILLNWQNKEGSRSTDIVYATNSDYKDAIQIAVNKNSSSYKLCNLIPNETYWLKIINNNTDVVKQLSFITEGRRRLINLSTGFNCRDLGGFKTQNGQTVKYGLLFRGGELSGRGQVLDDYDHDVLENVLKIKDVFDLRAAGSATKTPIVGADYHSIPLYSMVGVYDRNNNELDQTILNNYRTVLETLLSCLAEDRPVYVHCQGGCDRSNTICFLLMGVLGVSENDLALDYELSSFAQGARYAYNGTGGMIRSREPMTNKYHNNYKNAIEYIKSFSGKTLRDKFEYFWVNVLDATTSQIELLRNYMLTGYSDDSQTTGIHPVTMN